MGLLKSRVTTTRTTIKRNPKFIYMIQASHETIHRFTFHFRCRQPRFQLQGHPRMYFLQRQGNYGRIGLVCSITQEGSHGRGTVIISYDVCLVQKKNVMYEKVINVDIQ